MEFYQAQLPDGRFVRMRELAAREMDAAVAAVGSLLTADGRLDALASTRLTREQCKLALVAVSAKKPARHDPALLTAADWTALDAQRLEGEYEKLFDAKARTLLGHLYSKIHNPSPAELADFLGGVASGSATS